MPIMYNGKKLIPAPPQVSIKKVLQRGDDGRIKRSYFSVEVQGVLFATKGSPDHLGVFWTAPGYPSDMPEPDASDIDKRLAVLREKQGALCKLFCDQGRFFEIEPYDGTAPTKFIPRVAEVNFLDNPNDRWVSYTGYTITMETDKIMFGSVECCAERQDVLDDMELEESWAIELGDESRRTYKLNHKVNALGRDKYSDAGDGVLEKRGWQVAKEKVKKKLGIPGITTAGDIYPPESPLLSPNETQKALFIADSFEAAPSTYTQRFDYARVENADVRGGKYEISESWVLVDVDAKPWLEEYNLSIKTNGEDGRITVGVDGSIKGFEIIDESNMVPTTRRIINAESGWSEIKSLLYGRAQSGLNEFASGELLNSGIINKTNGKNYNAGTITYNYEYSNRPYIHSGLSGTDAISNNISVSSVYAVPTVAKHGVIARIIGPVFQPTLSTTEKKLTVTLDVQTRAQTTNFTPTKPGTNAVIATYYPTPATVGTIIDGPYLETDTDNWNPQTGRLSRTVGWYWI